VIDDEVQVHRKLTLLLRVAHTKDDVVNGLLLGTLIGIRLIAIGGRPVGLATPATAFKAISASLPAVEPASSAVAPTRHATVMNILGNTELSWSQ